MTQTPTETPIITFVYPLPGFPAHRSFLLVRLDDAGLLYDLRSVEDEQLRFLVAVPGPFFPEYAPEISTAAVDLLDTPDPGRLLVLLVVNPAESPVDATANLLAPIVIDPVSRRAVQVVLSSGDLSVRTPLVGAATG
jgi:flagellar assembly factor FliW